MDLIIFKGDRQIGPLNILGVADMFERGEISLNDNAVIPPNTEPQPLEQIIKQQSPIIQSAFGIKTEGIQRLERSYAIEEALILTKNLGNPDNQNFAHLRDFGYKKHSTWAKDDLRIIDLVKTLQERLDRVEILFLILRYEDRYDIYVATESDTNAVQKKSDCFIATAAYGSTLAPEVILLSHFRDEFLLKSKLGTLFVNFYYSVSPSLATSIAQVGFLRVVTRRLFLAPILGLVKFWKFRG